MASKNLYETVDVAKDKLTTLTCPDALTTSFVEQDSNGYVVMEAYIKQDESRKPPLPTRQFSTKVTSDYVEMKQQDSKQSHQTQL
jgi:hypothetical protein